MAKKKPDQSKRPDPGVAYREAKAALPGLTRAWADAELAKVTWLKAKRGVPAHVLYDAKTGEPRDPELRDIEAAEAQAHTDYEWGCALVVACGEDVKGRSFAEVLASQGRRPTVDEVLAKVED